jgi:hypothetical protein
MKEFHGQKGDFPSGGAVPAAIEYPAKILVAYALGELDFPLETPNACLVVH